MERLKQNKDILENDQKLLRQKRKIMNGPTPKKENKKNADVRTFRKYILVFQKHNIVVLPFQIDPIIKHILVFNKIPLQAPHAVLDQQEIHEAEEILKIKAAALKKEELEAQVGE